MNNKPSSLFSNSVTSPFDSFVIHSPASSVNENSESSNLSENSNLALGPNNNGSTENLRTNSPMQVIKTQPPPGPPILSSGASFRKPSSTKYVVPTEINVVNSPNSFNPSPAISPTQLMSPFGATSIMPSDPTVSAQDPSSVADIPFGTTPTTFMRPSPEPLDVTSGNYVDFGAESVAIPQSLQNLGNNPPQKMYHPVIAHWFYGSTRTSKWKPFSFIDSMNLEEAYRSGNDTIVATDGGRYDVNVVERIRTPIYWKGENTEVRRCSWFKKNVNVLPEPYEEEVASRLEEEYKDATMTGVWHRQIELEDGGRIMINSPVSMHHYPAELFPTEGQSPLTIKRGADDFEISDGESDQIDHLLFVVHGIGSAHDLSFRPVEDCVNDFRSIGETLVPTHFKKAYESGQIGRVEILPISWHEPLHGETTGLDERLKPITLRSIPKLREFTNDTILDALFYTSPVYCQLIIDTVASELERILKLFKERHPDFNGGVSLGGHSLGSVILFDILMHQNPSSSNNDNSEEEESSDDVKKDSSEENIPLRELSGTSMTSSVNFEIGTAGTGQPSIKYPQLSFKPDAFFLFGSPVSMFITVRGLATLGLDFKLPTCDRVFNIYHPFDPVAYRLETLIDPTLTDLRPSLIPHHKGRKRLHLELKDTLERVGTDIKAKIVDSLSSTWNMITSMYSSTPSAALEQQVDQAIEQEMSTLKMSDVTVTPSHTPSVDVKVGQLNGGRRIDYVLQEKPYESFTEYLFALQAHLTYWGSEDTMLLILNELYSIKGIFSDAKLAQEENAGYPMTPTSSFASPVHSYSSLPITEPPQAINTEPVPLFSPSSISLTNTPLPPASLPIGSPTVIGGRPTIDPTAVQTLGMDPTVTPASTSHGPPPSIPLPTNLRKPPTRRGFP